MHNSEKIIGESQKQKSGDVYASGDENLISIFFFVQLILIYQKVVANIMSLYFFPVPLNMFAITETFKMTILFLLYNVNGIWWHKIGSLQSP